MHTTSYISNYINGELCSKVDIKIKGVCSLDKGKSGFITFAKPLTKKESLIKSKASAIIVSKNIDFNIDNAVIIKVDNPIKSFIDVLKLFNGDHNFSKSINKDNYILGDNVIIGKNVEIGDNTIIADNVKIGDNSFIGSSCFIGRCVDIQSDSVIDSNVTIYHDVRIGKNVKISSGAVIGGQGFGFIKDENNDIIDFPHIGNVIVSDNVSIGGNTCVDRGTIDSTIIGANTKIDNLVQIAHNVYIGKNCIIAAQTGIAGSSVIGDNVTMAGQVGVIGHILITNNVIIASKSTVMKSITKSGVYSGTPAIEHNKNKRIYIIMNKLPQIYKKLKKHLII